MKPFIFFTLIGAYTVGIVSTVHATNESQSGILLLLIEPGAKQAGMGEAYSAIADDASAGYYNPAGLAYQGRNVKNFQFMHTNWLPSLADDMYYEYLGYSQYAEGWGNFAFNIVYFNMGEQARTTSLSSEIIGTFHSFEVVASGSYGATMTENFSLGLTMKVIYSRLSDIGQEAEKGKGIGSTFALDFGSMYKTPVRGLTLSAVVHNLGPKISYIDVTQADPLPLNVVFGAGYVPFENEFNKLTFVLDVYKPLVRRHGSPLEALYKGWYDEKNEFEQVDFKVGAEYVYNKFIALRAGYSYDKDGDLQSPTFGVGIIFDRLNVDIAYYGARDNPMQDSTRFSAAYNF
ncbi:MAG TPA: PorV/PorQ family protein [Anaerolineae bacterium]|nr:PorV/PorQ family protein [Anaerolineae bacterium]